MKENQYGLCPPGGPFFLPSDLFAALCLAVKVLRKIIGQMRYVSFPYGLSSLVHSYADISVAWTSAAAAAVCVVIKKAE